MTLYDLWLSLLQTLFGTIKFFKDHPTVPGLIYLIFKQNSIRKIINKQLPKKFRDTVDSDILEIKEDVKLIKKHFGVVGEWQSNGQQNGLKRHPLSFNKLYVYLRKATKLAYLQRRKRTMLQFLRTNISKKLLALLVGIGVTALNKKFNLQLSPDETLVILLAALGYITGQSYVDGKKAIANSVTAVSQVVQASTGVTADTTYKDLFPTIKTVHEGINKLLADVQKNDASDAFKDAAGAYLSIMDILKSIEQPEPLPEIPVQQESA